MDKNGQVYPCEGAPSGGGVPSGGVYLEVVEREVAQARVHPGEVAGLERVQHPQGGAERQGLEVVVFGELVLLQAVVHCGQAVVSRLLVHTHPWGGTGSTQGHDGGGWGEALQRF